MNDVTSYACMHKLRRGHADCYILDMSDAHQFIKRWMNKAWGCCVEHYLMFCLRNHKVYGLWREL